MRQLLFVAAICYAQTCVAQDARIVKLQDLQRLITENSTGIHIINFWATWCAPCVKELPFFEKINAEKRPDIKVTLVSMDLDLDPHPEKVYKFISRKNLQSEVVLLDETDPNSWIDKIDKQWSGALPATLIINHRTGKRLFIERSLREGELEQYLDELQ